VEAKTTVDELFGRHSWELPTLKAGDDRSKQLLGLVMRAYETPQQT
jgi:hypothetical protein